MIGLSNMVKSRLVISARGSFVLALASASLLAFGAGCGGGGGSSQLPPSIDPPDDPTLPNAKLHDMYDAKIAAKGGTPPFSFMVSDGQLPDGLTVAAAGASDPRAARVSGTANKAGRFDFTLAISDTKGQQLSLPLSVYVRPDPLEITSTSLPMAKQGNAYDQTLAARGGLAPLSWSVSALPNGLSLDSSGHMTGTPQVFGTFNFKVRVDDAGQGTEHLYKEQDLRLLVVSRLPMVATSSVPKGRVGQPYSARLVAQGGDAPYRFTISAGQLPPGVDLVPDTGEIRGVPMDSGMFFPTIHVTDASGQMDMDMYQLQLRIIPALTIATTALGTVVRQRLYDFQVQAAGGEPPYTWSQTGNLPPGIVFDASGHFRGQTMDAAMYPVTITVQDREGFTKQALFTLTVSDRYEYQATIDAPDGIPIPRVRTGTIVSYVTVPIEVVDSFQVQDVSVKLNIEYNDTQNHDFRLLRVVLFGPDGSESIICGNGANVPGGHRCSATPGMPDRINAEISDSGARPDTPLSVFKGMNARGTWNLNVGVVVPNNVRSGHIRSFGLSIKDDRSTANYVVVRGYGRNNLVTSPFIRVCSNLAPPTRCGGRYGGLDEHEFTLSATVYDVGPNGYPEGGGGDDRVVVTPDMMTWAWAVACASAGSQSSCAAQSTCIGPVAGQPGFCGIADVTIDPNGHISSGRRTGRAPVVATGGGYTTGNIDFRVTPPKWNHAFRVY